MNSCHGDDAGSSGLSRYPARDTIGKEQVSEFSETHAFYAEKAAHVTLSNRAMLPDSGGINPGFSSYTRRPVPSQRNLLMRKLSPVHADCAPDVGCSGFVDYGSDTATKVCAQKFSPKAPIFNNVRFIPCFASQSNMNYESRPRHGCFCEPFKDPNHGCIPAKQYLQNQQGPAAQCGNIARQLPALPSERAEHNWTLTSHVESIRVAQQNKLAILALHQHTERSPPTSSSFSADARDVHEQASPQNSAYLEEQHCEQTCEPESVTWHITEPSGKAFNNLRSDTTTEKQNETIAFRPRYRSRPSFAHVSTPCRLCSNIEQNKKASAAKNLAPVFPFSDQIDHNTSSDKDLAPCSRSSHSRTAGNEQPRRLSHNSVERPCNNENRKSQKPKCNAKQTSSASRREKCSWSYPNTCDEFSGIPSRKIGDVLQLWDFITNFSALLRLPRCSFDCLEQALISSPPQRLLEDILERFFEIVWSDTDLCEQLGIGNSGSTRLHNAHGASLRENLLSLVSAILENDDGGESFSSAYVVEKLFEKSKENIFQCLPDATDRIDLLRRLMEYACATTVLRECVTDSIEHDAEEKRKARDEVLFNRRRLELEMRKLQEDLVSFRERLVHDESNIDSIPRIDTDGRKSAHNNNTGFVDAEDHRFPAGIVSGKVQNAARHGIKKSETGRVSKLSRKDMILATRRAQQLERERRGFQRKAELTEAKLEKVKASLKLLRNIKLRHSKENQSTSRRQRRFPLKTDAPQGTGDILDGHSDVVRTYSLGIDRQDRAYWYLPGTGRLWIEDARNGRWSFISNMDDLGTLQRWLSASRKCEDKLKENLTCATPFIEREFLNLTRAETRSRQSGGERKRKTSFDLEKLKHSTCSSTVKDNSSSNRPQCDDTAITSFETKPSVRRSLRIRVKTENDVRSDSAVDKCSMIAKTGGIADIKNDGAKESVCHQVNHLADNVGPLRRSSRQRCSSYVTRPPYDSDHTACRTPQGCGRLIASTHPTSDKHGKRKRSSEAVNTPSTAGPRKRAKSSLKRAHR